MRNVLLLFTSVALLASCEQEPKPQPPVLYPGQYKGEVLFDVCGNIAVRFIDGTQRGQMGWTHGSDTVVYNNVFKVSNPCTWGWDRQSNYITFSMSAPEPQQCAQCLAWTETPDTVYNIRVVK